ncbi:MAG: NAD(P)H-binding protein [Polyangiaceae bacterium]
MADVVVFGASGGVGSLVVERLLADGHAVTAVLRTAADFGTNPRLRIAVGSPLDGTFVARCLEGRDAVVSALGVRRHAPWNPWSRVMGPVTLTEDVTHILAEAMPRAGIRRIVGISAAGAGASRGTTNAVMRTLVANSSLAVAYADLEAMERVLAASALDWIAVRPVTLTDGPTHAVREVASYDLTATISRRALAAWIAANVVGTGAPRTGSSVATSRTPMIARGADVR